jgi:hypothetical protein
MDERKDVTDFIFIDEFLTDMVRCGGVSEERYSQLMRELDAAFERSRLGTLNGSVRSDLFTPTAGLKPH